MKIGIIGMGGVGSACLFATLMRGLAQEIVVVDRNLKRAQGIITDMQYGATLSPTATLKAGDYPDLSGADLVMITAGVNEQTGEATNRNDPSGRLKLLEVNAAIYREIVSKLITVAPQAVILVVTDPPDPLAQIARQIADHDRVLSAGTYLDSLRFRWHLAQIFNVSPQCVEANVVGEHGTSEVFLWSSVSIGGTPLSHLSFDLKLQEKIEHEVRYANITIIEGINASQYGIGMVCARIAEIVVRNEYAVIPIGSYQPAYGTTLSLPSIVGNQGVIKALEPGTSPAEKEALQRSAAAIKNALKGCFK